jgi:hypothetical protein
MWRDAGLHISQAGYILPSNDPAVHEPMADDMVSNALIWLMMKLVNFISAGDEFPHEMGLGVRQIALLEYWQGLERQLDIWFEVRIKLIKANRYMLIYILYRDCHTASDQAPLNGLTRAT